MAEKTAVHGTAVFLIYPKGYAFGVIPSEVEGSPPGSRCKGIIRRQSLTAVLFAPSLGMTMVLHIINLYDVQ